MKRKFVLLNTSCLLLIAVGFIACQDQPRTGGTTGGFTIDSANAAKYIIPLDQARTYQQRFITTREALQKRIADTSFFEKNFNLPNSESFSKDALLLLLSQPEADAVRMYYGKDEDGNVRLVLMPIRKDGSVIYNKLLQEKKRGTDSTDTTQPRPQAAPPANDADAVETGQTCPPCIL